MPTVPWDDISETEIEIIYDISYRAVRYYANAGVERPRLVCQMDLVACHLMICPLDLTALLAAPDHDFVHDVMGIARHLDRDAVRLKGGFMPKFAIRKGTQ